MKHFPFFLLSMFLTTSAWATLDADKENWSAKYKASGLSVILPLPPRMDRYQWDRLRETKLGDDVFVEFFYWEPGMGSRQLSQVRVWVVYQVKDNKVIEVAQEDSGFRELDPKQPNKVKSQNLLRTRIRQSTKGMIDLIVNQRIVKTLNPSR